MDPLVGVFRILWRAPAARQGTEGQDSRGVARDVQFLIEARYGAPGKLP
jgi:hypothetical protein